MFNLFLFLQKSGGEAKAPSAPPSARSLHLATKVAISFVYYSPNTIKCTQKPKIEKRFTGIDQSSERASERVPFSTSHLQLALAHASNSRIKNDCSLEISTLQYRYLAEPKADKLLLISRFGSPSSSNHLVIPQSPRESCLN